MQEFEAERGRWFLGGCVAVFALPFFIAGINLLNLGVRGGSGALILLAIGIGVTALSVSFVALIWFGLRQMQAAAQRRHLNPMQPWLWRDDWAARRVAEGTPRVRAALWIFALMWNAITIPMAVVASRRFVHTPMGAIFFLFAAIGVVLLGAAAYAALRQRKFGRSICAIDRVPLQPG